ncbi:ROK family transcriptional regulator [Nonomuraea sp. KC401]|uniref:ROK family transcriptional regulator n=1 Tax=unclassified Nonomuraea TaxID=2593643 RepID=UPI0010FE893F|nr:MULTISPECIES: ROK family transcriptional regulator [unclassified Nonomuraea]NBE95539.1 ROK family protein [Nonomuraea sp. K271]TLF50788.1 ROK family transcriptional regulator [Nonomuraea sp. KC401]
MWDALPDAARSIVKELIIHGPQSRTALAKTLHLSTGSLTRLTRPLVDAGLLVEDDVVHDPVNGRPTRPLDVAAGEHRFLGIKLTADRIHAVITDLRAGVVAARDEPIADHSPDAVCRQARRLLDELTGGTGVTPTVAAGVTIGGDARSSAPVGDERLIDAPFLGWRQVALEPLMEQALGIPCVVKNDVAALAHQHHWFGAGRGLRDFALLTIGAGIGYALIVHDHLVAAAEADLGMFAHLVLDPGGPMCAEGHRGCASAYLSSDSIELAAGLGLRRAVTYEDVMREAAAGDQVCLGVVREAAQALGRLIAHITTISLVKTVILAGEGVELARVGKDGLDAALTANRRGVPGSADVVIEADDFREWARGGAVVAIQSFVTGSD